MARPQKKKPHGEVYEQIMHIFTSKDLRGWIIIFLTIGLLYAAHQGVTQINNMAVSLNEINASLNELSVNTLRTQELKILNSSGDVAGRIYDNGSAMIISRP